jgi:hypothetical protein
MLEGPDAEIAGERMEPAGRPLFIFLMIDLKFHKSEAVTEEDCLLS